MNMLNWLFTATSLSVLLVTVERYSFTTKILLQPYNFIRLHEVVQMCLIILITVLIPILILRELTKNFELLKSPKFFWLVGAFIVGVYFYATGNGVHEVSSFYFNNFCEVDNIQDDLCGSFFINDYYLGNILYFFGAILMTVPLMVIEYLKPVFSFTKKQILITFANSLFFALAIFAYSGFDRVLVGLYYSVIITLIALGMLFLKKDFLKRPYTFYVASSYTIGTLLALIFRLR